MLQASVRVTFFPSCPSLTQSIAYRTLAESVRGQFPPFREYRFLRGGRLNLLILLQSVKVANSLCGGQESRTMPQARVPDRKF